MTCARACPPLFLHLEMSSTEETISFKEIWTGLLFHYRCRLIYTVNLAQDKFPSLPSALPYAKLWLNLAMRLSAIITFVTTPLWDLISQNNVPLPRVAICETANFPNRVSYTARRNDAGNDAIIRAYKRERNKRERTREKKRERE